MQVKFMYEIEEMLARK